MTSLDFRRQFLACSEPREHFASWRQLSFAGDLHFEIHPDLNAACLQDGERELLVLGYLLDPDRPEAGDAEILRGLLAGFEDRAGLTRATERLGGRWLIFARLGSDLFCFADPCGLRQLVFTDIAHRPFYLASQPGLIAAHEPSFRIAEQVQAGYLQSKYYRSYKEFWWPAGSTLFDGIRQLAPNHLLDLKRGTTERFWPVAPLPGLSVEAGARQAGSLLRGSMSAAHRRFKLALPLTAGYDSRSVLAASREIAADIFFYTCLYYGLDETSADVSVPAALLKSLGLDHHVVDCTAPVAGDFKKRYFENVSFAHPAWLDVAYGSAQALPPEAVCVKGNASEIVRGFYYKYFYPWRITGRTLSYLAGFGGDPFMVRQFERWLDEVRFARKLGYDILDLLYWEQRMGVWQAASQLEFDIAAESFTPFNNRALLVSLLGVPHRFRQAPDYSLFKALMRGLWPDVLAVPLNPSTRRKILIKFTKSFLRRFGIIGVMKRFK